MRSDENYFQFGEIKSSDYKVYCSGGGTYSAPARDVELFHVLGRDGDLVVDHGSYQNIEVTYPCWVARNAPTWVTAFRQQLCSLRGYQRIIDPYHPDEFRLGIFQAAFEPDMRNANNDSAEFDVVFNCKPQRFLTAGEDAVRVTSGQSLTNPTYYDAHPILEAYGYGVIYVGGSAITIQNVPLGPVVVLTDQPIGSNGVTINDSLFNDGDPLSMNQANALLTFRPDPYASSVQSVVLNDTGGTGVVLQRYSVSGSYQTGLDINCEVVFPTMNLTAGTSWSKTHTFTITVTYLSNGTTYQATSNVAVTFAHSSNPLKITRSVSESTSSSSPKLGANGYSVYCGTVSANSSVSANGAPTYIDLDIGEAWIVEGGEKVSVNKSVSLPDLLPVLKADASTAITFTNTITQLDVVPRWYTI